MNCTCPHEDADWPVDGDLLCTACLLMMMLRMEAEDLAYGELATEVIQ